MRLKHKTFVQLTLLLALSLCALVSLTEARGGRGRGGGSFGGIFGGWRKYKKPSSPVGSTRRVTNGSPMHTTATKQQYASSVANGGISSSAAGVAMKKQAVYPKQQLPTQNSYASYYGAGGAGWSHMPAGSSYHANTAAMPPGAIYYAQPPMRSTTGDFFMGMMAGHMLSDIGHRPYVTHVYQQNPEQAGSGKVIIINNGGQTTNTNTNATETVTAQYWPTDTDTPLAPFNSTVTSPEQLQTGNNTIFPRIATSSDHLQVESASPPTARAAPIDSETDTTAPSVSETDTAAIPPQQATPPLGGIICMPVLLNETDPNDPQKTNNVERIVCFPAPPPPTPEQLEASDSNCLTRVVTETDPNDPTKTIEVPYKECSFTTTEPPIIAGEIGESINNDSAEKQQL